MISVYKLTKEIDSKTGKSIASLEKAGSVNFGTPYLAFDIDNNGLAVVFSGKNTISLYESTKFSTMTFVRNLPLFEYKTLYEFVMSHDNKVPVFKRMNQYLIILMQDNTNQKVKKLLAYDLEKNSHS